MEKIKFGLIGCGHIAPRWLSLFVGSNDIELVAIADPDPNAFRYEQMGEYLRSGMNPNYYPRIEDVYDYEDIDAVIIATPPQYHARYVIDAIERGKPFIVEKPLCVTEEELSHIKHAVGRHGIITNAVNHQYRWNPRINTMRAYLLEIGNITSVLSKFVQNEYHFEGWWRQQSQYISMFNWFVHSIDSMRYMLRSNAKSIWCKMKRPTYSKIKGYSQCNMYVEFENGVDWNFFGVQEGIASPTTSGHGDITFFGQVGTLINRKHDPPTIYKKNGDVIILSDGIKGVDDSLRYPPTWNVTMEKFVEAYHTGKPHPTNIHDIYNTMDIVFGAIKSFESGKVYEIPTPESFYE